MKRCGKRFISFMLSLCLLISANTIAFAADFDGIPSEDSAGSVHDSGWVRDSGIGDRDAAVKSIAGGQTEVISSDDMDVLVDSRFPRVMQYTMKNLENKVFYGQPEVLNTITINKTDVRATGVTFVKENRKITYTIPVKDLANNIDVILTAEFVVYKNTLTFNITDVKNNLNSDTYPVETIDIPDQSLVSVRSTQEGANFKGAVMSVDTAISGDRDFQVKNAKPGTSSYMYGFVSSNDLSAGIWSNSEIGDKSGGSDNNRITVVTANKGDYLTTGLKSAKWYYCRKVNTSVNNQNREDVVPSVEKPSVKVVIAGDENKDNQIDWQDGAIAFRNIMNNPLKSDEVPDLVAYRIAMNFGSHAQNPFLETLDNVKKVALHTDGLGQSVLLKGYASEGHDSGHPDYWNVGQRIGGVKDMNTLMEKGAAYGARFGIHVNASEMYPEAKAFSEDLVRWDGAGKLHYGWNWLDQGVGINALFDLVSKQRADRFKVLHDKVGSNLDFVYVDVWGNGTSGAEDAWQTRLLSQEITSLGWRVANEWGFANEYDSTFQHWAADLTYGGSTLKGINSEVMRFLRNHQKDSWVADYPSYGAAAQAPLLGGYSMKDFEGWQGRSDYNAYIKNLFAYDLSTKFIQHYKVTKWVDGDPVQMLNPKTGKMTSYVPDKQITLSDADAGSTVQITRKSADPTNMNDYRTRTITLNGSTILQGRANGGDYKKYQDGDETYLIPWYWGADGKPLEAKDQKLYHWNTKGGTTTWTLSSGWENVESVKVYQLTDQGKTNEQTVQVQGGKITLTAAAQTPYVVTKGSETNLTVDWSTGMHITDAGFNSGKLDNWTVTGAGNASVVKSMSANEMLKLSGESTVTQKLTDLEPGKKYAAYVGLDNRSSANASITIKDASGKVMAENYSGKSIAKNYVSADPHSTDNGTVDGSSYFQNMYVFFTAPADGGDVTLTLSRAAGEGDSYFDNIRIVENEPENIVAQDSNGNVTHFRQDFEHNAQGLYPFVVGPIEGVSDNRTHLAEKHAPYTQEGWNIKKTDDVLSGDWSVKTNGLSGDENLVYQTIPQNFHFLPGKTYQVSFRYQAGSEGTYGVIRGSGEFNGNESVTLLPIALGNTKKYTFAMEGNPSGLGWFGIYSTSTPADVQGTKGSDQDFAGYKDFMLDDLEIQVCSPERAELIKAVTEADSIIQEDYTPETWGPFAAALAQAQKIMDNGDASEKEVVDSTKALLNAKNALKIIYAALSGTVKGVDGKGIPNAAVTLNCSNLPAQKTKTDANGNYSFKDILVRKYAVEVSADHYAALPQVTVQAVGGTTVTKDFVLYTETPLQYTNTFENGDISFIDQLDANPKPVSVKAVEINGNSAMELSFPGGHSSIADTAAPKFKNGTFEADVTPVGSGIRFGFTLRGVNIDKRLFVGCGDQADYWFAEYWNGSDSSTWSDMYSGPALEAGVTRRIKVQVENTVLTLWVDGQKVINELELPDMPQEPGYVGFECRQGSRFVIDNISVSTRTAAIGNNVSGKVVGGAKELTGASVVLKDSEGKIAARLNTAPDGSYTLTNIPKGNFTLTAGKDGFVPSPGVSITVNDMAVATPVIALMPTKSTLRTLYTLHKDKEQGTWQDSKWKAFTAALNAAKAVLDKDDASAEEIHKTFIDLQNAVDGVLPVDTAPLRKLYDENRSKANSGYTAETWSVFQQALASAKMVLEQTDASQNEITNSYNSLLKAIGNLQTTRGGGKKSGSKSDDKPSGIITNVPPIGKPVPYGCKSDTIFDMTVHGAYQFKITSTNGKEPTFVIGTSGVFQTELVRRSGDDYFYKVTPVAGEGLQAGVYVNGTKLLVLTAGKRADAVVCDTRHPFAVKQGQSYTFKLTASKKPRLVSGNKSFQVDFVKQIGNDYFYKSTAAGRPGDAAGFYVDDAKTPVTVVTIK